MPSVGTGPLEDGGFRPVVCESKRPLRALSGRSDGHVYEAEAAALAAEALPIVWADGDQAPPPADLPLPLGPRSVSGRVPLAVVSPPAELLHGQSELGTEGARRFRCRRRETTDDA